MASTRFANLVEMKASSEPILTRFEWFNFQRLSTYWTSSINGRARPLRPPIFLWYLSQPRTVLKLEILSEVPTFITTEKGRRLRSNPIPQLTSQLECQHFGSFAYLPNTNSQVERLQPQLKASIMPRGVGSSSSCLVSESSVRSELGASLNNCGVALFSIEIFCFVVQFIHSFTCDASAVLYIAKLKNASQKMCTLTLRQPERVKIISNQTVWSKGLFA